MAELASQQLVLLLATCIKQHGKDNVLRLLDQKIASPMAIRLHPGVDDAILVLLEGQTQIDQWSTKLKELEETIHEIPERGGQPDDQTE